MQLPHAMEPQLHAQVGTEVPVKHFHCTSSEFVDTF